MNRGGQPPHQTEREMKAILDTINTTVGVRYIVLTYSKSKQFKTMKGAEKYMKENGYTRVEKLD